MGMRFRKSVNVGKHVRINVSKSGIGGSIGVKGARITKTASGRTRKTISIPNTGISYVSESGGRKSSSDTISKTYSNHPIVYGVTGVMSLVCGILCILCGLILVAMSVSYGWVFVILGIIFFICGKRYRKTYKQMKK